MAYLALYRRLRPESFSEVIGQDHITTTLLNQIKRNQVGHAYLFTGTRGVGKTSVARLFAKAICCLDPKDGRPCGKCAACLSRSEASPDIVELDAASNNGVDNVRDIRDGVIYPPAVGKRKVYIIDEVHMLTGAAFNALLKTLEEPPEYVVFILCTTEVHKLPQTIMSRCMRFDFRLVGTDALFGLLKKVFEEEKKECEESALYLIAENARGSVRDALSIADRCLTISGGKLTYAEVADALGSGDVLSLRELIGAVISRDAGRAVTLLSERMSGGTNPSVLAREIGRYFRNLTVVRTVGDPDSVLKLPESLTAPLREDAKCGDTRRFLSCAEVFTSLEGDMRYSLSPQLILESAVIRCALDEESDTRLKLELLENRMERIEKTLSSGTLTVGETETDAVREEKKPSSEEVKSFSEFTQRDVERSWARLTASARKNGGLVFDAVKKVTKVEKSGKKLRIQAEPVIYELISGDKALSESLSLLIRANFGDAAWEIERSDVRTESEVVQKLKELTDGKLRIEK